MNYDKLLAAMPINSTAARVTGRGVHWAPDVHFSPGEVHSDTPLPTRPWPASSLGQDNLTGRIVGRLTVVGLAAEHGDTANGTRWVVRCACGAYEHRRTKYIRNCGAPQEAMCKICRKTAWIMAGRPMAETGK